MSKSKKVALIRRVDPDWRESFPEQCYHMTRVGATIDDMAEAFAVPVSRVRTWMKHRPELQEAFDLGCEARNERVVSSLYARAVGYEHQTEKIFCSQQGLVTRVPVVEKFPPDPASAMYWLKNRQRGQWVDVVRHEVTGKDGGAIELQHLVMSAEEAGKRIRGRTFNDKGEPLDGPVGPADRALTEGVESPG